MPWSVATPCTAKKTALTLTSAGADALLALKDNQPTLHRIAGDKIDGRPPDWTSALETGHGRIEYRELRVCGFDLDTALFPGARQLLSSTRYWRGKHEAGGFKSETRHFITTLAEGEVCHARLAQAVRAHWSVENKNHWRKDATAWREDQGARRKPRGAMNLALLRNALLAVINPQPHGSLNQTFIHYDKHPTEALRLIRNATPQIP